MEQELVAYVTDLIGTLGFPIFVAIWLLIRTDKYIRKMQATLDELLLWLRAKNGNG